MVRDVVVAFGARWKARSAVKRGAGLLIFWLAVGTVRAEEPPGAPGQSQAPRAAESGVQGDPPVPPPVPAVGPPVPPAPDLAPTISAPQVGVPANERKPLIVLVASSSAAVPREAFLGALQRTLRRPLLQGSASGQGGEELSIRYDEQTRELMVSCYRAGTGPVTRVIEAPSDPGAVPEAAALLAENLCALELVAPPNAVAQGTMPTAMPAPAPPVPVAAVELPREHAPAVVGAFYPFATNYERPGVRTNLELNLFYGRVGALDGIGLGTVHFIEADASGLVVGGLVSVIGGRASGLFISGLATSVQTLEPGISLSLAFNHSAGIARGGQASLGFNFSGPLQGAQLAGVGNVARGPVRGIQASSFSNVAENLEGMQISLVNVASDVAGVQVGLVNVAARVRGLQLGLVNVSEDVDGVPLGLFNVSRSGGVHVASWFSTTTYANIGVKLATQYTYTMLTLGYHRVDDLNLFGGGLILGGRIPVLPRVSIALDVGGDYLLGARICCYDDRTEERIAHTRDRNHFRLRVLPTWQVHRHFAVFAGPAAALHVPFALYSNLPGYDQDVELLPEFDMGVEL